MRAVASLVALCASVMGPAKDAYCAALHTQPLLTKSLTCATLFTSSDLIAQIAEGRAAADPGTPAELPAAEPGKRRTGSVVAVASPRSSKPTLFHQSVSSRPALDTPRLARMAVYAGVIDTPLSSWFVSSVEGLAPGVSVQAVLIKAAAGQVLWCPVIVAIYLTSHGLLRGNGPREIGVALQRSHSALRTHGLASLLVWGLCVSPGAVM